MFIIWPEHITEKVIALILKLDISKPFESVLWEYLLELL
jgi:hypothetical protein